jgi:hypothetical protein
VLSPQLVAYFGQIRRAQTAGAHSFQGIDEAGQGNLRWIADEQMDVIRFPAGFAKLAAEVRTHLLPRRSQSRKDTFRNHFSTVLRYEDQVGLKAVDDVSTRAKVP